jgi:hypothetical protein
MSASRALGKVDRDVDVDWAHVSGEFFLLAFGAALKRALR